MRGICENFPCVDDDFIVFMFSCCVHSFSLLENSWTILRWKWTTLAMNRYIRILIKTHNKLQLTFDYQKMLTDIVKNCMATYTRTLKEKSSVVIDQDTADGYITRALSHHYEKNYFNIAPSNVKTRMSEEELRKKL